MIARIFKSRLFVGVASAATAIALIGGVAYAVTVVQPSSSDKYYACFSNTDYLKGKIYLNMAPPTCPAVTDVVRSWDAVKGAVGATGPSGSNGVAGPTGPAGATGSAGDSYRPINLCSSIPGPSMNFSTCNLENYDWPNARLSNTWFVDAHLERADLSRAHLAGADFTAAWLGGTDFEKADLTGAKLDYLNTWLQSCSPDSCVSSADKLSLRDANATNATLTHAGLYYADLIGADFTGADLSHADIRIVWLANANLTNANLTGATGTPLYLSGVIYNNTICPTGVNSDTNNAPYFDCFGQWL